MRLCNEAAWWRQWRPIAVCTQPYGTVHSHSDLDADEAVKAGVARYVSDNDTFYVRGEDS